MGTRANTTLAWVTTGLLVITAPFAALGALDDGAFQDPPVHVDDVDAGIEPDTQPGDEGTGIDTTTPGTGVDAAGGDAIVPGQDDATGPRLPDGGVPAPLPNADTNAGCQCGYVGAATDAHAPDRALAGMGLGIAGVAIVVARRRRRRTRDD